EYFTALNMVEMAVAVDHILHRHIKTFCELCFQPAGDFRADGVGENNAFLSDQENTMPHTIAEAVQILLDGEDLWAESRLCERGQGTGQQEQRGAQALSHCRTRSRM